MKSVYPITEDLYSAELPCKKDNFEVYNADGTGTTDEGATKCDPSDPQTYPGGNWALLNNDTQLRLSNPAQTTIVITADILELDDSHMKIKYPTSGSPGAVAVTTTVIKHSK